MESYLKNILGIHVDIKAWTDTDTLPDELREEREYYLLEICGITCLVITMLASDFQMSVFTLQESSRLQSARYEKCPQKSGHDK